MSQFCSKCGSALIEDAAFCSVCGTSLNLETQRDTRNLMQNYKAMLKQYGNFSGRSTVREYWMFYLMNFLIYFFGLILIFLSAFIEPGLAISLFFILFVGYSMYLLIPGISVAVRRLHDQDYPGLLWLVSLVPVIGTTIFIVLMCLPGTKSSNRYGPQV